MTLSTAATIENSGSGTISALNGAVTVDVRAVEIMAFTLTGTWVATITPEATNDGTNWFSVPMISSFGAASVVVTSNQSLILPCAGYRQVRLRASAYTSGTATVAWNVDSIGNVSLIYNTSFGSHIVQPYGLTPTGSGTSIVATGIDTGNSSATPLAANATFTGTWIDVSRYSNATVNVFTSHASATDGLIIDYSSNGSDVDDTDTYSIIASNGQQFSFPLPTQYFRVRYTNGGTLQTAFRLQTKLHNYRPKPSSHRVKDIITDEQDAELVKAAAYFSNLYSNRTGNGTFTIKSGAGLLHTIVINNDNTQGQMVVYDNTAGSGTVIMTCQIGSPSGGLLSSTGQRGPATIGPIGAVFTTGLTIVMSGSASNNITVYYR